MAGIIALTLPGCVFPSSSRLQGVAPELATPFAQYLRENGIQLA
jgi:hypothetical protein